MTTDIFITAPLKHLDWLVCCLRSIEKNFTGFRRVVFVCDIANAETWNALAKRFPFFTCVTVKENGNGHLFQMWAKTTAYQWTDADQILYVDSDCLFRRASTPEDFTLNGKPLLVKSAYVNMQHAHIAPDGSTHPVPWQKCTEAAIGPPVEFEYMRISGQLYPRWLPMKATAYLEKRHGMTSEEYVFDCGIQKEWPNWGYSEFNYLGAYAERFHADDFSIYDLDTIGGGIYGNWPIDQCWTHGKVNESPWKERIEAVLS